ncbi:hypothetical protein ACIGFK_11555 [Streptomyces sp. NPDC085524]|uniref:hypothetical protein n=1 Tax=unclassified Streptomyces TaxID=2593676 RepID=UPI0035E23DFD
MSAAAIVAAGVGLIPSAAQAADPVKHDGRGISAPDVDLAKAVKSSNVQKFSSPAEKSVRRSLPAAKAKGATSLQAEGASVPNPNLALVLNAQSISAHGIGLGTEIISETTPLKVTIDWGDGKIEAFDAPGAGQHYNEHVYAELGEYNVTITVTDINNAADVYNVLPVSTAGSDFTPYAPTRLLDTRDGTGVPKGKVAGRGTTRVKIAGNGGIPEGVTAVALNVTVTNTLGNGYITAFPEGGKQPTSSNVNFVAGQSVPNMVIVPVGKNGYVDLFNGGWESVDVIADVTGYFTKSASSGYTPMTPSRFVDTREGLGTAKGQLAGRGSFTTQIGGLRSVPQGIKAVALNVTVTNPQQSGHLAVYPGGGPVPASSNLNFTAGQTIANSVIVPVSADGKISVFNGAWAATDVVVDVVGYYSPGSTGAFMPIDPQRMFDTREPNTPFSGALPGRHYIPAGLSYEEPSISGFVLNTTVTNTNGNGYLVVAPDPNTVEQYENGTAVPPQAPNSSNLNWTRGATVPNLVQASTGTTGIIDFFNQGWEQTDLVVDVFGFYDTK